MDKVDAHLDDQNTEKLSRIRYWCKSERIYRS